MQATQNKEIYYNSLLLAVRRSSYEKYQDYPNQSSVLRRQKAAGLELTHPARLSLRTV